MCFVGACEIFKCLAYIPLAAAHEYRNENAHWILFTFFYYLTSFSFFRTLFFSSSFFLGKAWERNNTDRLLCDRLVWCFFPFITILILCACFIFFWFVFCIHYYHRNNSTSLPMTIARQKKKQRKNIRKNVDEWNKKKVKVRHKHISTHVRTRIAAKRWRETKERKKLVICLCCEAKINENSTHNKQANQHNRHDLCKIESFLLFYV